MSGSDTMLLLTYTPRSDADARDYDGWLREVDNPFFNNVPGIVEYTNWKVTADKVGRVPFSHFDTMLIDGPEAVETVWADPDVLAFADGWRETWALNPDGEDLSVNYQVALCRQTSGGTGDRRSPHVIFIPHIRAADVPGRDYDAYLRDVDVPFFNAQPPVVHYSNWRVVSPVLGRMWFTDFDLMFVDDQGGFERVLGEPEIAAFADGWAREWGYDPSLVANVQAAMAQVIASPREDST